MENVKGIVLDVLDYREKEKILRVYTREEGKLSLLIKPKGGNYLMATPLSESEFIFQRSRGSLHVVKDASLINPRFHLRKSLSTLTSAGTLLQIILKSQLEEKPTPALYELLMSYLDHLPLSPNHSLLIASFKLKLLKYEGLLGETPPSSYSNKEWENLLRLAELRSYRALYQTGEAHLFEPLADRLFTLLNSP
jgi:DNA repair protein RecO